MNIIILTSIRKGIASRCLPTLCANPRLNVVRVVLANGASPNKTRALKRRLQKTWRIGLLGALNGVRLRDWYCDKEVEDLSDVCRAHQVELVETEFVNSEQTRNLFREVNPDLGLSLGNGYIGKSVYSIPRFGMINIHTEVLPRFQGAQSIIWPLYEGVQETGFTIHQIDAHIDTGDILFQQRLPISFYPTLRETVEQNLKTLWAQIPAAFSEVCENYKEFSRKSLNQGKSTSYTTPTFGQFLYMLRKHKEMYQASRNPI
jgi:methionyl-tRNA formyltransferase